MNTKRVLVTGSAGFIASHLTDLLVKKGYQVFAIDDLSGGSLENVNKKSTFFKIDLKNQLKTQKIIAKIKPEIIFHLAADATEGRSQFTPIFCVKNNLNAYLNTLIPAIKNGLKKILLVSSMSIYGDQKTPFSENLPPKPVDIYGVCKTSMEKVTEILADVHNFKYTIVRPHNVYGPRQNLSDPYRNVIGIFINLLMHNKPYYIYGDGNQKRSFTYIDDCVPYILKAGLGDFNREIINVGTEPSQAITINELSKIILNQFLQGKKVNKTLKPIYLPDRPKEVSWAFCTNTKSKKLLRFKQKTSLEEGIAKTIIWAKSHGAQKFKYLNSLELISSKTPKTWRDKLL